MAAISWRLATVTRVTDETPSVRTLTLSIPDWPGHRPGQHVDLRLTAEDGYSVERSYSVASEPERGAEIDITVERIPDGEVSPFLHEIVVPGDRLEVRGPIGGYFVWDAELGGPVLLVGGGSGVVPLMAMLRHRRRAAPGVAMHLLASWRTREDIIYREELEQMAAADDGIAVVHTLTRSQPQGWAGYSRRIDAAMLADVLRPIGDMSRVYACGPTSLVETAANALVRLGVPADKVRTERFGPTGT